MEPRLGGWWALGGGLLQVAGGVLVIAILVLIAWLVLQALSEAYAPVFRILSKF